MDSLYKRTYHCIFEDLTAASAAHELDECAIPSYTHRNKLMSWLFWKRITVALSLCETIDGKRTLDFGCGAGVSFKYLSQKRCDIMACDTQYHDVACKVAKQLNAKVAVHADIADVTGPPFDYILALDVLEHVDDLEGTIESFRRLSHPQTRVVVSGPTENFLYKCGRFLAGFSGHYHHRSIYHVEDAMKAAGFTRDRVRRLCPPVPLFRISSWSLAPTLTSHP